MGQKILVVSKDPNLIGGLKSILGNDGYEVIEADTAIGALEASRGYLFENVVIDACHMGINSNELCDEIKSGGRTKVSGYIAPGSEAPEMTSFDLVFTDINDILKSLRT